MTQTLIKNIRIIDAKKDFVGNVIFQDDKFLKVSEGKRENLDEKDFQKVIDGTGKTIFPGLIDPHVHFREPGFEYKEDIESGSKACISHGVTSFFDMPNTQPATFTVKELEHKNNLAKDKSWAHFGFYFGAGMKNQSEIMAAENIPGVKLYLNATTGNLKMDQESRWREVFHTGKTISLHAEGETFKRAVNIWLEEKSPCDLHLCHASLKSEVDLVRDIKKDKKLASKISMEVCPHHLFMTHKEREKYGALCCMKPELTTQKDLEALWEGVEDGTIDFFATDHAPHTLKEKQSDTIFYGIPGVETFFHLLFTEFKKRNYDLKKFSAMTSLQTFQRFGIKNKGLIEEGFDADFVIIKEDIESKISAKNFHSKCKWTPFEGFDITGEIQEVWSEGKRSFEKNNLFESKNARALKFETR